MRWFEQAQIADMVLSARADSQHPGYVAMQPIFDLIELIARQFKKRDQPRSRSSLCAQHGRDLAGASPAERRPS